MVWVKKKDNTPPLSHFYPYPEGFKDKLESYLWSKLYASYYMPNLKITRIYQHFFELIFIILYVKTQYCYTFLEVSEFLKLILI